MLNLNTTIFLPFLVAFLATLFLTPLSVFFIKKAKIMDDPKKRNHPGIVHKIPVPRAGAIALFLGVF